MSGGDARISHVAFIGGELIGGWRRTVVGDRLEATVTPVVKATRDERERLAAAAARFAAFFAS